MNCFCGVLIECEERRRYIEKIPECPFALAICRVLLPESGSIHERRSVEGVVVCVLARCESVSVSSDVSPVRARKRRSSIVPGSSVGWVAVGMVDGVLVRGVIGL